MNRTQKAVIILGILIIILSWLLPAYEGEYNNKGITLKAYMGHHFIFNPPSLGDVENKVWRSNSDNEEDCLFCHLRIVYTLLIAQLLSVFIISIGLFFLFSSSSKSAPIESQDHENEPFIL
ncbi:MAG: hypothetical protein RBT35_08055 [Bacteroidales bacterium]|jgi:hypothetical protein|nr:hypothetical protein [Bacteroidales bacterium]